MNSFAILGEVDAGNVIGAGIVLLLIGLIFVIILTVAYSKLKVEQDPLVEAIIESLPGANCGGCGLAGCNAYAEGVVLDHGLMGKCGPGGEELVHKIAQILGIEVSATTPTRAFVHCSAKNSDRINPAKYHGSSSCAEAQMVAQSIGCPYGCFGLGDCGKACDFDAVNIVDGLATVDYEKCVGCGACVNACPRQLIELLPLREDPMMVVGCASLDKAKDVREYCKVGCVGCTLCAKLEPNMFQIQQNLAVIDYEKYSDRAGRDKVSGKCPRAMLVYVGTKGLEPVEEAPVAEPSKDEN